MECTVRVFTQGTGWEAGGSVREGDGRVGCMQEGSLLYRLVGIGSSWLWKWKQVSESEWECV